MAVRPPKPIIGITADLTADKYQLGRSYGRHVEEAGGIPIILPCCLQAIDTYLDTCGGFVLSGGDDPLMEHWGIPTPPEARPVAPQRQAVELALLDGLAARPRVPVLGICLGMQMMALPAGGRLNQYLPDTLPTASDHWDEGTHPITGDLGEGVVHSHHRQAITDPGALQVVAAAHDGVIEAVQADDRPFFLGVQWHPERTDDRNLGCGRFERLIAHCTSTVAC